MSTHRTWKLAAATAGAGALAAAALGTGTALAQTVEGDAPRITLTAVDESTASEKALRRAFGQQVSADAQDKVAETPAPPAGAVDSTPVRSAADSPVSAVTTDTTQTSASVPSAPSAASVARLKFLYM